MFIQHPHDLCCVHCGAAAQCNDHVRLERPHQFRTLLGTRQCGIGLYIREYLIRNAHFLQRFRNAAHLAAFEQEFICYQKCTLPVQDFFNLTQSHRQAAFFEVHLLRCAEPQHIFSPLSDSLDIQ